MTTIAPTQGKLTIRADGEANRYTIIGPDGRWLATIQHNGEQLLDQQLANVKAMAAGLVLLPLVRDIRPGLRAEYVQLATRYVGTPHEQSPEFQEVKARYLAARDAVNLYTHTVE